ncbi:hypothetical protein [Paludibacterium sp. B53371]|uniref:hypothetical protein n=1 Tax=Paludibacterium sp. B53371 TaxID=2806263 RepID=UPI001C03C39F|nr:hypothetical protein [Paludibacterium sp. B53371]
MKTTHVTVHDTSDGCQYTFRLTQDDILAIINMPFLGKRKVDLPSLPGDANLKGDDLTLFLHHPHGIGVVDASFSALRPELERAFQSFRFDDDEGV